MPRPLRFGVVGLRAGRGGAHAVKRYGGDELRLTAVCDRDAEHLARVASKLSDGVQAFEDFDAMLASGLDAVYIATPPAVHAEMSIRALEAGCHVHVEKPMATSPDDAQRMVDTAERCDRRLSVGFELRGSPLVARIRQAVDAGEVGAIRALTLIHSRGAWHQTPWRRTQEGTGGFLAECTIHEIDLFRLFGGEVTRCRVVTAPASMPFYEDLPSQVNVVMDFDTGAQATLLVQHNVAATFQGDPLAAKPTDEALRRAGHWKLLSIAGDRGAIVWDFWTDDLVFQRYVEDPPAVRTVRREDLSVMPRGKLCHDMGAYVLDFARRVARGQPAAQTADDALRTHLATWEMDRQIAEQMRQRS
ncbi:MAG: Gfo/Idh/MocA family oxidoreductase [Planctomycetota bacterium]